MYIPHNCLFTCLTTIKPSAKQLYEPGFINNMIEDVTKSGHVTTCIHLGHDLRGATFLNAIIA